MADGSAAADIGRHVRCSTVLRTAAVPAASQLQAAAGPLHAVCAACSDAAAGRPQETQAPAAAHCLLWTPPLPKLSPSAAAAAPGPSGSVVQFAAVGALALDSNLPPMVAFHLRYRGL